LLNRIKIFGIHTITGNVYFDNTYFDPEPRRLALKCLHEYTLKCPKRTRSAAKDLAFEAVLLSRYQHENIIGLHAISADFWTCTESRALVLDYIVETLQERLDRWRKQPRSLPSALSVFLRRKRGRDEQHRRSLTIGLPIARGMEFLHSRKIIYRDLKPTNIGFDAEGHVRIFDFGLARKYNGATECPRMSGFAGTLRYMAPEIFSDHEYGFPADVYSFAMVLWEICTLQKVYPQNSVSAQLERLVVTHSKLRPPLRKVVSRQLRMILEESWHWDEKRRLSFASIVLRLKTTFSSERFDL